MYKHCPRRDQREYIITLEGNQWRIAACVAGQVNQRRFAMFWVCESEDIAHFCVHDILMHSSTAWAQELHLDAKWIVPSGKMVGSDRDCVGRSQ